MKILVYTSLYPLPENIGTRMRTMNFVRFFNKMGEVDLVYRRAGSEDHSGKGPFRKEYRIGNPGVSENNVTYPSYTDFKDRIKRLADRRPWILSDWPKRTIEELNAVVTGDHYDLIFCRYMQDSYPFLRLHGSLRKRVIIDFDDVFSTSLFDVYVRPAPGIYAGLKLRLQKKMLVDYQKRFLKLGAALFCSVEDMKEVAGLSGPGNAHVVPNTYPPTIRIRKFNGDGYSNRRTLLFVGALDYAPNITGLKWFLEGIFPMIKERYHDAKLLVVGRRPPESLVNACEEHPGVELHPDVPDVGSYYEKCGVVVVPLLSGGGTRIKILEAAMAGRPVLSTPLGAHGLEFVDKVHLMLFQDKESFLERYSSLDEEGTYKGCVGRMHAIVEKGYSPATFERSMEVVVEGLLRELGEKGNPSRPDEQSTR